MVLPFNRVLVVEDDPASRSFLGIALAKQNYVVVAAENAAQAQHRLPATGPAAEWNAWNAASRSGMVF